MSCLHSLVPSYIFSIDIAPGRLYPLVHQLDDDGLIELRNPQPAGKSGKERAHYGISEYGIIRLQEEVIRLKHAIQVAENSGLISNPTPPDIQRLLLNLAPDK